MRAITVLVLAPSPRVEGSRARHHPGGPGVRRAPRVTVIIKHSDQTLHPSSIRRSAHSPGMIGASHNAKYSIFAIRRRPTPGSTGLAHEEEAFAARTEIPPRSIRQRADAVRIGWLRIEGLEVRRVRRRSRASVVFRREHDRPEPRLVQRRPASPSPTTAPGSLAGTVTAVMPTTRAATTDDLHARDKDKPNPKNRRSARRTALRHQRPREAVATLTSSGSAVGDYKSQNRNNVRAGAASSRMNRLPSGLTLSPVQLIAR